MKNLFLGLLILISLNGYSQLTFVKEINGDFLFTAFDDWGYQYAIEDNRFLISRISNFEYDLLNKDFTFYKKLKLDTTGWKANNYSPAVNASIADHMYNTDDKIEIIFQVNSLTTGYGHVKTIIQDEDGNLMKTINDEQLNMQAAFKVGNKSFAYSQTNVGTIKIYEIGGNIPCATCGSSATSTAPASAPSYDIMLYPNPTSNKITLAVNVGKDNMTIHIYTIDGKLVKTVSIINGSNFIDTTELTPGTYIYNVVTDKEFLHGDQFIKK